MDIREAVVLAAGLGLRMRPLTDAIPKPAVPFLNRPTLHWTLDALRDLGVKRVFVNLHHIPMAVRKAAESGARGLDLRFSFEPEILGTAGLFGPLKGLIQGDAFFVVNGDVFHQIPMSPLAADLESHPESLACLAVRPAQQPYTPVAMDGANAITAFGSPLGAWMFTGVYAARRTLLENLPCPGPRELIRDLFRPLLPSGTVRGVPSHGRWYDLGSPRTYLGATVEALHAMASGGIPLPQDSALEQRDGHLLLKHRSAWVSRDATLTGPVVAGEKVRVEARAHIGRAVLLTGVSVARGNRMEDAIAFIGGAGESVVMRDRRAGGGEA